VPWDGSDWDIYSEHEVVPIYTSMRLEATLFPERKVASRGKD
jgi:hypothetical protein